MIFVDSSCGKKLAHFKSELITLETCVDADLLVNDSKLWEEPFYVKWEHYLKYPINIYNGNEIPYKRTFHNITVNQFTNELNVKHENKFFVSSVFKN